MTAIFDYRALADRLGFSPGDLRELEACIRRQYGSDEMMFELRMVRTLLAIEEGAVTLADAVRELGDRPAEHSAPAVLVRGAAGAEPGGWRWALPGEGGGSDPVGHPSKNTESG